MRRLLLMLSITLFITACGMHLQPYGTAPTPPQSYWEAPSGAEVNRQKDNIECQALASQAASGAGGWTSVAPIRDAI